MVKKGAALEALTGISLEDPQVVEAVRLFEARNKLIDRMTNLNDVGLQLAEKETLSIAIRRFIDEKINVLVVDMNERIMAVTPKGESVVRQLSVMREVHPRGEHAGKHFLPKDVVAALHVVETNVAEHDEEQQSASVWKKDLLRPFRRARAVRQHDTIVSQAELQTRETVASFLTSARAQWSDQLFQDYDKKLANIEELTQMAETIAHYQSGGATSRSIVFETNECQRLFEIYIRHPGPEQFRAVQRAVETLRMFADFKTEDIVARIQEWQLHLKRDMSDALAVIEARATINPDSISENVRGATTALKDVAETALQWLQGIAEKIEDGSIKPELQHQMLVLLANRETLMAQPQFVAFYKALKKLECEKTDINPLTEPRDFVRQFVQFYNARGLPEWGTAVSGVAEKITQLLPQKRAIVERELQDGAIAILMPGRSEQKLHFSSALINLLKPVWIKNWQRKNVKPFFWWKHVQKLIEEKSDSLFSDVPDGPYILLTKPTQAPNPDTCNKTVQEQHALIEQMKRTKPEIFATNIPGYVMMQAWYTAQEFARNPEVQEIKPLDFSTYTRFISLQISDGYVPVGDFKGDMETYSFLAGLAGVSRTDMGFRFEVRIPL